MVIRRKNKEDYASAATTAVMPRFGAWLALSPSRLTMRFTPIAYR
jgi:hypothetical protein